MRPRDPTTRYFGTILIGVGVLMMALCGACSALGLMVIIPSTISLVHDALTGQRGDGYASVFVQTFLLFGLIPIMIGAAIYLVGRRVRDGEWPKAVAGMMDRLAASKV